MIDLSDVLTFQAPFGPNASEDIGDDFYKPIFDKNNTAHMSLRTKPFLIVGRRGSGKTAILSAIKMSQDFSLIAEVPSNTAFQEIVTSIDISSRATMLPESVCSAWEKLFWTLLFSLVVKEFEASRPLETLPISNYLVKIGVTKGTLPRRIFNVIVKFAKKNYETTNDIVESLNELLDTDNSFDEVKQNCIDLLKKTKTKAAILIDNIEQIDLSQSSVSTALVGLLMAVDGFKNASIPVEVRCCIPAEIYLKLVEMAANPDKSFTSETILHWSSHELIHLAAIRFREFLRLNAPTVIYEEVAHLDFSSTKDLDTFIHTFFPRHLDNPTGGKELTLRYILRHTQLLPRQFISYLNTIAQVAFKEDITTFHFTGAQVIEGVKRREPLVCRGVFSGYEKIYPFARQVCASLLPELELTFGYGEFEKLFRQKKGQLPFFESEYDCLQVLIEIGIVGVVEQEDSNYLIGEFAYNLPLNLALKTEDRFCLHPAFSGAFRSIKNHETYKPIFPKGADFSALQ